MAGPEFFQTVMGRQFYEGAVPKLIGAIERVADALESQKTIPSTAAVAMTRSIPPLSGRASMDAGTTSACLYLLRKARDDAPGEWDALAHSGTGGTALCELWDILNRVEGEGA
jgi:hypothetical protein